MRPFYRVTLACALAIIGFVFFFQINAYWWDKNNLNALAVILGLLFVGLSIWQFSIVNKQVGPNSDK